MTPIRIGVLGVGRAGSNHCRVFSFVRHAKLAGVCDLDSAQGTAIAREYGVPFYSDVDELLTLVDAVSIATPTPTHFHLAMHCLRRGVHVLVEKPITETVDQAEILTEAAEASGLVVQVGHIERFNPTYTELKNVLEGMTVLVVNFRRLSPFAGSNTDVDVVLDLMIHDLDLVEDLTGKKPILMNAFGLTAFHGAIDHAVVNFCFDSGPLLTVTASRLTEQKVRLIEVTGLEAYAEGDLLNKSISIHRSTTGEYLKQNHRGVKYRQAGVVERIYVPSAEPLHLELQHFVDCIIYGGTPLVPAADGLKALRLATQVRRTIQERLFDINIIQQTYSPPFQEVFPLEIPIPVAA